MWNIWDELHKMGCKHACDAHGLHCVPLYDTLGAGAVKYIICHADISIIFIEETKFYEVFKTLPESGKHLKILSVLSLITKRTEDRGGVCVLIGFAEIFNCLSFG
ncbi:hypothetical protein L1987_57395 [Smallanthus sonchifolius]|uniref:Uncharacterized protein n=1 Tax=Smallanthus sonchifolius TaxID=185202 RepID=A0ACB9DCW2_9ASTR|nr:hypothetical protein L1987_57395 [Smallanthus sonchifolius]